jgi:hypothetical protein
MTGTLMPQIPTPLTNRYLKAARNTMTSAEAIKNGMNQNCGVRRVRTTELILSVTVANVWRAR